MPATVATLQAALEAAVAEGASGPCLVLFGHAIGETAAFALPLKAAQRAEEAHAAQG